MAQPTATAATMRATAFGTTRAMSLDAIPYAIHGPNPGYQDDQVADGDVGGGAALHHSTNLQSGGIGSIGCAAAAGAAGGTVCGAMMCPLNTSTARCAATGALAGGAARRPRRRSLRHRRRHQRHRRPTPHHRHRQPRRSRHRRPHRRHTRMGQLPQGKTLTRSGTRHRSTRGPPSKCCSEACNEPFLSERYRGGRAPAKSVSSCSVGL